jgi:hypothetical protein
MNNPMQSGAWNFKELKQDFFESISVLLFLHLGRGNDMPLYQLIVLISVDKPKS